MDCKEEGRKGGKDREKEGQREEKRRGYQFRTKWHILLHGNFSIIIYFSNFLCVYMTQWRFLFEENHPHVLVMK